MLTCEEIAKKARALAPVIDRANYHQIAEAIHPCVDRIFQRIDPRTAGKLETLPEVKEGKRGQMWLPTNDWLDMVIFAASMWQANAAARRFLKEKGARP